MLGFISQKQPTEKITDKESIDATYKYWRLHLMLSMYVGYGVFYFTRKSLNFSMPVMLTDLGWEPSDIGVIATVYYVTYGTSKFISGMISDNSNPKFFMGFGLIATGIVNVLFGFSSSLSMMIVLWMLNAFFQSWGWPACAKLLTSWYSRSERGFWWSIWNTCINVSGALLPILIGYIAITWGWRFGFIVPGSIAIVVGIILTFRMQDKPNTIGLPTVGDWRNDPLEKQQESEGKDLPFKQILKRYVLGNKYIWLLCSSYLLVYVVRIGVNDWGSLYLVERHNVNLLTANTAVSMFEVGGFLGSLLGGWGSDKFFHGNRAPMNLIFALGIFISVAALWLMPLNNIFVLSGCLFSIGFFIFGPQMMIGMAAAECSHKDLAGTATGFVGLFGYLGAALAGYPLSIIIEQFQWEGFFTAITLAAAAVGMLLIPFLKAQQRNSEPRLS
ncbi:regulatory protein UhpC [Vibrio sp. MACH09]|uniref:MFS transporter family glucose-6-phosphate receptor UhpC n=1 Tax=unclassified Vibrio TaxID=2614977 RepID=UPI001493A7FC|nr:MULTISPECIES: MFS transporter family glucose-6-phosphate receptor UhpC [unclassified Vibrio]NOI66479.1 MFS transporter [Vibrio sp. 99-8-1]GLO60520.1 regulatory protein UhpC [Vibrio sp. MACH09]